MRALVTALPLPRRAFLAPRTLGRPPASADKALYVSYPLIMTPPWRVLGPLEAANGMLMFGVTTALVFAVIQRLLHARFVALRD